VKQNVKRERATRSEPRDRSEAAEGAEREREQGSPRGEAPRKKLEAAGVGLDRSIRVKNFQQIQSSETLKSPKVPGRGTPQVHRLGYAKQDLGEYRSRFHPERKGRSQSGSAVNLGSSSSRL